MLDLYPHPFASIENELLRIDYMTTLGPRIIGLYAKGVECNLLAVTPDAHWPTPHGEYSLHGGHRLWTAPENPFYTCPEDHVQIIAEKNVVVLRSDVDAAGLEREITFRLNDNRVVLTHRVTWHGERSIELAPWAITQMRLAGMAILPQSQDDTGLSPNRSLVLWPYSHLSDERLDLHDDLILVHGRPAKHAFKIGNFNPYGWIAYATDNVLFIKRFSVDSAHRYADGGCNVECYIKDTCVELETLGPLKSLAPGESVTHEETWEVSVGEYPAAPETAHKISRLYR